MDINKIEVWMILALHVKLQSEYFLQDKDVTSRLYSGQTLRYFFSRQFKKKMEINSWRDSISEIASRLNRGQITACFRFDRRVSHCKLRLLIGGIDGIFCKLHCFCEIEQVQTIMFSCCLSLSFCI